MLAKSQSDGKSPVLYDWLNINARTGAIPLEASLSTLVGIRSGPIALGVFKLVNNLYTPPVVIPILFIVGILLGGKSGNVSKFSRVSNC